MGVVKLPAKHDYVPGNRSVKLPAKHDYFPGNRSDVLPVHPVIMLKKTRFDCLWRWFHTSHSSGGAPDETTGVTEEEEEFFEEEPQETEDGIDFAADDLYYEEEEEEEEEEEAPSPTRYASIQGFIDHVNNTSQKLCKHPGWKVSIDEMLRKFKGRSAQTYRMKRKPDREGYKFFAICCSSTGFVYSYFPDGRLEAARTKILDCVEAFVQTLPRRNHLQYLLAMDNYFTKPSVVEMTRREVVGLVGTARRQRNWPPRTYKAIDDKRYNTLYLLPDPKNFLIMRWVDNDVVDMVSTVHDGFETVTRARKRPRENQLNRAAVRSVWGSHWEAVIDIPQCIDEGNNSMGGVDKAYQLMSGLKPRLRCRRTWMPMWLHRLDVCRVNSYIIAKEKGTHKEQKDFVLDWILALNHRAQFVETARTRTAVALFASPAEKRKEKRSRMSAKNPELPSYRLQGDRSQHVAVLVKEQKRCTYCKWEHARDKMNGTMPLPTIARPARKCLACGDHLCTQHFDLFHTA
jgi:hypothetical protein